MTTTELTINVCYYILAAIIAIMFTKNLFDENGVRVR